MSDFKSRGRGNLERDEELGVVVPFAPFPYIAATELSVAVLVLDEGLDATDRGEEKPPDCRLARSKNLGSVPGTEEDIEPPEIEDCVGEEELACLLVKRLEEVMRVGKGEAEGVCGACCVVC